ncbi:MAG: hypothetical protein ACLR0I_05915 [Streptococcus salivarius]
MSQPEKSLESDVKVHAKTTDDSHTPLIWEKSYGKGKLSLTILESIA